MRFDVILPELDPVCADPFQVDMDALRHGTTVAGIHLQRILLRPHFLHLRASH